MNYGSIRQCQNRWGKWKKRYKSNQEAKAGVERMKELNPDEYYHAYQCKKCNFFHVGTVNPYRPVDAFAWLGHIVAAGLRGNDISKIPSIEEIKRKKWVFKMLEDENASYDPRKEEASDEAARGTMAGEP